MSSNVLHFHIKNPVDKMFCLIDVMNLKFAVSSHIHKKTPSNNG